ncbi:YihY/virulence factor BrkB family protein [Myroides odoratimimus]|uniref:YihY/virulence factor BrkB family protein n=1 Tax=Myroides odoratimimus TaxID=76832 RepID=UPI00257754F6|nr:YihY/virulence factor BrkB family protein [Myroides odoratimimus]MDM1098111.1 YihY/virulence factor BrkB family protein [Myroides odoratimimus]MDM1328280.1 YihY/virulence factor BrkB family protein [Myroides odoratimimus]MDM1445005.1 YihY/virulence factor BrkB family protein [Myroides odoratimimus]MDM1451283.1 YihY/virulence factor BrkB family protein [Myroides odoratimimus]MDM1454421.1 YihY/virulence factor BrkB family protein [Myroides odoratimimus]
MQSSGFKKVIVLFKQSVFDFLDDNAMKFSAALSYYTIFALPPLMLLIISASGFIFEEQEVANFFYDQLRDLVGPNTTAEIQNAMSNVQLNRKSGYITTIIGVGILLFSASGVFAEIQSSINYIWGLAAKPDKSIARLVKNRLLSFAMIGSVGFVLLVSLMINSIVSLLYSYLGSFFGEETLSLVKLLNNLVVFLIITILFVLIFMTLPNGKLRWKDAFIGAGFTAVLFMFGKFGIGWYLGNTASSSLYGAAGSVTVMLIWVYYSAMILYFGAEFTKNYAILYGRRIVPGPYSIEIEKNVIKKSSED